MATAGQSTGRLSDEELARLLALTKDADSVELKLTVPEADHRSAARALDMDPLDAQIRQVFFFDTPDLDLNEQRRRRPRPPRAAKGRRHRREAAAGRARRAPGRASRLADLRRRGGRHARRVRLLGLDEGRAGRDRRARGRARRAGRTRKLFSKEQRAFYAEHAPDGLELDDLSVLGPIFVLKLKFAPQDFDRKLVAELWLYPDGSRILELSTKCAPVRGVPGRRRDPCLPHASGRRSRRRAGDEDAEGARVLLGTTEGGSRRDVGHGRGVRRRASPIDRRRLRGFVAAAALAMPRGVPSSVALDTGGIRRMASPFSKLLASIAASVDHRFGWDRLPKPLGVVTLVGMRTRLREKNLYDTGRGATPEPTTNGAAHRGRAPSTAPSTTSRPRQWARSVRGSAATSRSTGRSPPSCRTSSSRTRARSAASC